MYEIWCVRCRSCETSCTRFGGICHVGTRSCETTCMRFGGILYVVRRPCETKCTRFGLDDITYLHLYFVLCPRISFASMGKITKKSTRFRINLLYILLLLKLFQFLLFLDRLNYRYVKNIEVTLFYGRKSVLLSYFCIWRLAAGLGLSLQCLHIR